MDVRRVNDEPARPPAVDDLLAALVAQGPAALDVLRRLRHVGVAPGGEYHHWDALRELAPPAGLTPEQWWLGVKLARGYICRDLPFRVPSDRTLRYSIPHEALATLHQLDRLPPPDDAVGGDADRRRHLAYALSEEAIRSSQLAGATTSVPAARALLLSGRASTDPGEAMVVATDAAIELLRGVDHGGLTPEILGEFGHALAGAGPTTPIDDLAALCRFANGDDDGTGFVHPVVRAVLLHYLVVVTRPFTAGNGRAARALFTWSVRAQGYALLEYLSVSRVLRRRQPDYRRVLRYVATDDGDTTYFVVFHLQVLTQALAELRAFVEQQATAASEIDALVPPTEGFNDRQLALLGEALRRPAGRYTFKSHARSHRVSFQSARTDLLELQDRALLVRRKSGREFVFTPAPDLADRLGPPARAAEPGGGAAHEAVTGPSAAG